MKSKVNSLHKKPGVGLFEVIFLALPFLALVPNTFIPPPLGYPGLATQELVFACAITVFTGLALAQVFRVSSSSLELGRENLFMFVALIAFILWQLISLFWAPTLYSGLRVTSVWFGFAVFFVIGISSLRARSAGWLFYALSFIATLLAISVIYERRAFGGEMRGIFFNHGISAELIVTILPFQLITYLTSEKRWLTFLSFAISGLSAIALLMGLRRGALAAAAFTMIAVGFCMMFKLIRTRSAARIWVAVALLALAIGAVGARYRSDIVYRIKGVTELQSEEGGLATRLRSWITAWEMGKSNPLIGVGNGGYPSLYGVYRKLFVSNPRYSEIARRSGPDDYDEIRSPLAHNEYLEIFAELGIIGLLLFLAFWGQVARALWRRARQSDGVHSRLALGALLGLAAFGISSISSGLSIRYTPEAFILACALSLGFARKDQEGDGRRISFPRVAALAIIAISFVAGVMFVARAYNVMASQRLQGGLSFPELIDFRFYPDNPSGNEALRRRYERVIELDSENTGARLGYALLLFQMKQPEKAIPHAEFALKHGYSRPFAYVLLAFACEQAGDLSRAAAILSECVASYPQSLYTRAAYAEILRKQGKIEEARAQQNIMRDLNIRDSQSWELVMRMKPDDAAAEAARRDLIPPDRLMPMLARGLVMARAVHYLK